MSYLSTYTVNIIDPADNTRYVNDEIEEFLMKEIRKNDDWRDLYEALFCGVSTKWCDEDDMLEFSKLFPDYVFEVEDFTEDGFSSGRYYKNGKMQEMNKTTKKDDFDEKLLR